MSFQPPILRDWCEYVDGLDEPTWLLQDMLFAGSATVISGAPTRAYKSWLAFQMALCAASGQSCSCLRPTAKYNTLFVEFEGPKKPTRWRFSALENGSNIRVADLDNVWFSHMQPVLLDHPEHVRDLCAFIKDNDVKLVFIDTLAKAMRGKENEVQDITATMRGADALRSAGAAVVFLHHLHKTNYKHAEDIDDELRGSTAIAGFADTHIAIRQRWSGQRHLNVTVRSNEAPESYYQVRWHICKEEVTAKLDMSPVESFSDVDDDVQATCISRLVPGEAYNKQQLQRLWDLPYNLAVETAENLKAQGILETKGRSFLLAKE